MILPSTNETCSAEASILLALTVTSFQISSLPSPKRQHGTITVDDGTGEEQPAHPLVIEEKNYEVFFVQQEHPETPHPRSVVPRTFEEAGEADRLILGLRGHENLF